jgi:chemotaxis protein histidine kinase CheA
MTSSEGSGVVVRQGDKSLKEKIGKNVNMRSIFTPEKIAAGEAEIKKSKESFAENLQKNLIVLEDKSKLDFANKDNIKAFSAEAFSLKGKAESLGYDMLAHITNSLCDYAEQHLDGSENARIIVRKHVQAIRVAANPAAIKSKAKNQELLYSLRQLIEKYHG